MEVAILNLLLVPDGSTSLCPSLVVWPSFSLSLHLYDDSVYSVSAYSLFMANIITITPDAAQLDATQMKRVSLPRAAHGAIAYLFMCLCIFKPVNYKSKTL